MLHRIVAATALLSLPLLAQETPSTTAAPARPSAHVIVETVGPDGWRARFAPTNVGSMLASEEGRTWWEPHVDPMFAIWHQLLGDDAEYAKVRERFLTWSGTARLAMRLDDEQVEGDLSHVALLLEGDGHTDLDALAADLHTLVSRSTPGEWRGECEVLGKRAALRTFGPASTTAPTVVDNRIVLLVGPTDDLAACQTMLAELVARPSAIGAPRPGSPALHVWVDVAHLIEQHGVLGDDEGKVTRALGFTSLDHVTLSVASSGPQVLIDVGVKFRDGPRGLFAGMMPDSQGMSRWGGLVPEKSTMWRIGRFDAGAFYEAIVEAFQQSGFADGDVRTEVKKDMGIDPATDLMAHMTDEVLAVGSPLASFDRASEATWALAWKLRDEAAFRTSFETMITHAKPFLDQAETIEVEGAVLRRYGNLMRYPLWMGVGNRMFVVTGGRDGEEEAARLLRAAANPGESPQLTVGKHTAPAGRNGSAVLELTDLAGLPSELWLELLDEVLPMVARGPSMSPDEAEEMQQAVQEMLKRHQLTTLRSMTGYQHREWHWQIYW